MHNILWTSGWDSTYRVLDLVVNKKKSIQPYYIVDNDRISTRIELETIEKIKRMIYEIQPESKDRIKETIIFNIKDIPKNDKITNEYQSLAQMSHLGGQYDWLARFSKSQGIEGLELSIHRDDTAFVFIKKDILKKETDVGDIYVLNKEPSLEALNIFSYYRFPLLDLTKIDMEKNANKFGFGDIMEKTWFCHSPVNNKPCGLCNPCKYTREEGLGRRVPPPTLKNKTILFSRKLKNKVLSKANNLVI